MRNFILGIIVTVIILAVVAACVIYLGLFPVQADITPPHWERHLAMTALDNSVERHAPHISNPIPPTDENVIAGMKIYTMNCALCHGSLDLTRSNVGKATYPSAPQIVLHPMDDPEWHIYYVVRFGVRYTAMPAWKDILSDDDMWKVTAFLSHIDKLTPPVRDYWKSSFGVVPDASAEPHNHETDHAGEQPNAGEHKDEKH